MKITVAATMHLSVDVEVSSEEDAIRLARNVALGAIDMTKVDYCDAEHEVVG